MSAVMTISSMLTHHNMQIKLGCHKAGSYEAKPSENSKAPLSVQPWRPRKDPHTISQAITPLLKSAAQVSPRQQEEGPKKRKRNPQLGASKLECHYYTKLMFQHLKSGQAREVLTLYKKMREEGISPEARTYVAVLKACSIIADLQAGKEIHTHVIECGYNTNVFVTNTLLDMYVKCGSIADACCIFDAMPQRSVVSWNIMIMGHAQMEMGELALQLYAQMQDKGFAPNERTFLAALKACCTLATQAEGNEYDRQLVKTSCLEQGRSIHIQLAKSGFESHIILTTALIDMYAKCGSIVEARNVFDRMEHHNVMSWNAMILGYAQMDMGDLALHLFNRMDREDVTPNDRTFVAALKACGSLTAQAEGKEVDSNTVKSRCLEQGKLIHDQITKSGFESDIFVANSLIDMYMKCGSLEDACQVFERMSYRDVVSWNVMITGYAQMEMGESGLQFYLRMQQEGFTPNQRTFFAALKACSSLASQEKGTEIDCKLAKVRCLELGKSIHSRVAKARFGLNVFVASALIDMYVKCGSIVDAHGVFEKMKYHTIVCWNAMITGYVQMEMGEVALYLYGRMQHEGFTPDAHTFVAALKACACLAAREIGKEVDGGRTKVRCLEIGRKIHTEVTKSGLETHIFVANTLIDMYAKCGSIVDARQVFETMSHHGVVFWNTMIMGYAQMEMGKEALDLYTQLQGEGLIPDTHTFVAALQACGSLASLEAGKEIHAQILRVGLEHDTFLVNCLIDMYCKCGSMIDAQRLFDALLERTVMTWNTLITGYSSQGDSEHVFNLYEQMQEEDRQPNGITFVSLLMACSHSGLVDKGQKYFQSMCLKHKITPDNRHICCMIDLFGRAGKLDETLAMVNKMPFEPVIVTWMTVLSACQKWKNVEIGEHAFQCAARLDARRAAAYVLMGNISVCTPTSKESTKKQAMLMNAVAKRNPGY